MKKKHKSHELQKAIHKKPSFWSKKWVKITYRTLLGLFIFAIVIFIVIYVYVAKDLPSVVNLDNRKVVQSTQIYDRT